jgi:hypothetical protein
MAIEAPVSRYKTNTLLIGIAICVGLSLWCAYDGYLSKTFKDAHPEWWVTNRAAPFFLLPIAAVLAVRWYAIRDRKLIANDSELVFPGKARIAYDAIESIDKTYFDNKGFFTIFYKQAGGPETKRKLSDRDYDNLPALLDHLIAKIT